MYEENAARHEPRGAVVCVRNYGVQVDAIIRTDVTWIRCAAADAVDPLADDPPLAAEPFGVVPGDDPGVVPAPAAPVLPAPVVPLVDPVELDAASVPVTSTWWPLCCVRSDSRPSRM